MPRMNILNTVEREAFNSPPVFSSFQRKQYFDYPSKLRRFAAGLRNPVYQLGFLLSAGYFKAARRFYSPGSFHPRDVEYVARQLEPGAPAVDFAFLAPANVTSTRSGRSMVSWPATLRHPTSCSKRSLAWCDPRLNPR